MFVPQNQFRYLVTEPYESVGLLYELDARFRRGYVTEPYESVGLLYPIRSIL